jgi:saccharopine dehydrogenase-like NADP-dependent oxidoreductase
MRYPGHAQLMRFLIYELIMKNRREQLEEILTQAKPPVQEDVVYVYAVVEGWIKGRIKREEFYRAYTPIELDGVSWRAISWTTAASIAAVVEMVADGKLPDKGFIKQEDIPFDELLNTSNGAYFKDIE